MIVAKSKRIFNRPQRLRAFIVTFSQILVLPCSLVSQLVDCRRRPFISSSSFSTLENFENIENRWIFLDARYYLHSQISLLGNFPNCEMASFQEHTKREGRRQEQGNFRSRVQRFVRFSSCEIREYRTRLLVPI